MNRLVTEQETPPICAVMGGSRGVVDVPGPCPHAYVWAGCFIDDGPIPITLEVDEIVGAFHNGPGAVVALCEFLGREVEAGSKGTFI